MHTAAQKLEKAIRERQDYVPALLEQFAIVLHMQVSAIQQALNDSPALEVADVPTAPLNGENAMLAIGRLKALLEASDGDAQEAFQSLQRAVAGLVEKSYVDALGDSINDFDFERALATLSEIAQICESERNIPNAVG